MNIVNSVPHILAVYKLVIFIIIINNPNYIQCIMSCTLSDVELQGQAPAT